jgi:hypothetical protein
MSGRFEFFALTSAQSCPVEPFGGTDDFAVSDTALVYTTKDTKLPEAMHTKQDVSACFFSAQTQETECRTRSTSLT